MSKSPEQAPAEGSSEDGSEPSASKKQAGVSPHVWVSTTYFAEGFPYSIVNNLAEVLFKEWGAGLRGVGLTALLHLPWNIKFLWASLLDRYETKRSWLVLQQWFCALVLVALAVFVRFPEFLVLGGFLFLVLAFASATNDIAIDGYYMEALGSKEQSKFVGYRAMAYKLSSLLVRGPGLILIGLWGWSLGLLAMAVLLAGLAWFHSFALPRAEPRRESFERAVRGLWRAKLWRSALALAFLVFGVRWFWAGELVQSALRKLEQVAPPLFRISVSGWIGIGLLVFLLVLSVGAASFRRRLAQRESLSSQALAQFLALPRVGTLLAFVVLFRAGESLLQKMKWPFLSDHVGLSLGEYGFVNGTVGVIASFVATFWGGRLIARDGLRRWFWPFLVAQNGLNLCYVALALVPDAASLVRAIPAAVIVVEEFGSGLGTAVFMVFLMRSCHPDHKAAHFAILTALMSLSFTFAGAVSGFLAEALGYAGFFAATFVAAIPMMILANRVLGPEHAAD